MEFDVDMIRPDARQRDYSPAARSSVSPGIDSGNVATVVSRKEDGVNPVCFLNTELKTDFELNPALKHTEMILSPRSGSASNSRA